MPPGVGQTASGSSVLEENIRTSALLIVQVFEEPNWEEDSRL